MTEETGGRNVSQFPTLSRSQDDSNIMKAPPTKNVPDLDEACTDPKCMGCNRSSFISAGAGRREDVSLGGYVIIKTTERPAKRRKIEKWAPSSQQQNEVKKAAHQIDNFFSNNKRVGEDGWIMIRNNNQKF